MTISRSVDDTISAGKDFGARLKAGAVVGLVGDLGAGKTHFVKGVAHSQGVDSDQVSSPTFTIAHEYHGTGLPLYHLDCYRLKDADELERTGAHTYIVSDGICLIEWPQRIESLLPPETILVSIRHEPGGARRIRIHWPADHE